MPILISKTYEVITPESAKNGEVEYSGFLFEEARYSFRELVDELRHYSYMSSTNPSVSDWAITEPETDYRDGSATSYSLHYCYKNSSVNDKYWRKALKAAGLTS